VTDKKPSPRLPTDCGPGAAGVDEDGGDVRQGSVDDTGGLLSHLEDVHLPHYVERPIDTGTSCLACGGDWLGIQRRDCESCAEVVEIERSTAHPRSST